MGLPGVSARGVSGPGRAPPVRCGASAPRWKGGAGDGHLRHRRRPQFRASEKNKKRFTLSAFLGNSKGSS